MGCELVEAGMRRLENWEKIVAALAMSELGTLAAEDKLAEGVGVVDTDSPGTAQAAAGTVAADILGSRRSQVLVVVAAKQSEVEAETEDGLVPVLCSQEVEGSE